MNRNDKDENIENFKESVMNVTSFTKREMECLFYLVEGLTYKDIGKILDISHRTVEAYVRSMLQKAQVKSTKELLEIVEKISVKENLNFVIGDREK